MLPTESDSSRQPVSSPRVPWLVSGSSECFATVCSCIWKILALWSALARLVQPRGIVSIVTKSADTLAMRPALAGDWQAALVAFDADHQVNGLGVDTRADTVGELSGLLQDHAIDPVAWYGVRLFSDGWSEDRPASEATEELLAVELEASRRDPYRQLSRLFHLVGVRSAAD